MFLCIDGKLSKYGNIGFRITIGIEKFYLTPIEFDLLNTEHVYSDFYCSLLNNNSSIRFGLGKCPNNKGETVTDPSDPPSEEIEFAGGTGTEEDPYLVVNAEQLNAVRYNFDAYYKQMSDISLAGYSNWVPINGDGYGGYDGNGYCISDLTITEPPAGDSGRYIGLFGNGLGKTLKNIILENININIIDNDDTNIACIGGIVGSYNNTMEPLINCHVLSGKISWINKGESLNSGMNIGGISGYDSIGILKCTNSANIIVEGTGISCGGIVGSEYEDLSFCVNRGSINVISKGKMNCGGVIGYSSGIILDCCVNFGEIAGCALGYDYERGVGGIIGYMYYVGSTIKEPIIIRCANYVNVNQQIESDSVGYVGTGEIIGLGMSQWSINVDISNCYNLASEINGTLRCSDGTSIDLENTRRIMGYMKEYLGEGGFDLNSVYSLDSFVNDKPVNENTESTGTMGAYNGSTISVTEMNSKIQPILDELALAQIP